tara:strand:+ start:787 stop:1647 length:861 start_codon:yes stop_codon:yes gene_type:complete
MWRQVWKKLADHKDAPNDIFCELYRELNSARETPLDPATELANIVDDQEQARVAFRDTKAAALLGEVAVLEFLERAHTVIEDFGSDALTNRYFKLIRDFLDKYSLRYDLRRPFSLHPTLPGMFARLIRDLKVVTSQDAHLTGLMRDFEECVRDLKVEQSPRKIKHCLAAQVNLLEALLILSPDVVAYNAAVEAHNATASRRQKRKPVNTFGAMCEKANVWPHDEVLKSAKSIYSFCSDYPGIRHGGTRANVKREIDMRDLIGVTVVLAGLTPYLTNAINSNAVYSD